MLFCTEIKNNPVFPPAPNKPINQLKSVQEFSKMMNVSFVFMFLGEKCVWESSSFLLSLKALN